MGFQRRDQLTAPALIDKGSEGSPCIVRVLKEDPCLRDRLRFQESITVFFLLGFCFTSGFETKMLSFFGNGGCGRTLLGAGVGEKLRCLLAHRP